MTNIKPTATIRIYRRTQPTSRLTCNSAVKVWYHFLELRSPMQAMSGKEAAAHKWKKRSFQVTHECCSSQLTTEIIPPAHATFQCKGPSLNRAELQAEKSIWVKHFRRQFVLPIKNGHISVHFSLSTTEITFAMVTSQTVFYRT